LSKTEVFSLRLAPFGIFALGAPRFSDFQQSAQVCTKQNFSARNQHVLSFLHLGELLFSDFQQSARFDQNSVFSPRSARFAIFALGTLLFSDFH